LKKFSERGTGMCVLFIVVGAILGGLLGEFLRSVDALRDAMPYLAQSFPVFDMMPATINLFVIKLTFGISFMPNLMSVLGIIIAFAVFYFF